MEQVQIEELDPYAEDPVGEPWPQEPLPKQECSCGNCGEPFLEDPYSVNCCALGNYQYVIHL